ncbi:hypothetical protein [Streptomyces inhibens]|uniref:hypothetical protein n=1 Tax=Streptomyces inhibens TaxID=2293571 RepID=UPI001EE730F8|nr:hypothetical protein [Streptomyces inhibens]UKY52787.1 hypothetical protein KI385_30960 [Streptomyces inhibens]
MNHLALGGASIDGGPYTRITAAAVALLLCDRRLGRIARRAASAVDRLRATRLRPLVAAR